MHILDFYRDTDAQNELKQILTLGAQHHPSSLPENFLEKDLWVTEILRLLYEENLIGDFSVAFKGGTALSKCWKIIDRFSEDIDLSIHWADLAGAQNEAEEWEKSIQSNSQKRKFRDRQAKRLEEWAEKFVQKLNARLDDYGIDGLCAELVEGSKGEKVNVHFPRLTTGSNDYQLDHILLEFGGRNRGLPTVSHDVCCYLGEVKSLNGFTFPKASVQAFDSNYILWEKLTALHQFSCMSKAPKANRLARHWYDVDCLMAAEFADPLGNEQAMLDVVEMKKQRWAEAGVDYDAVLSGALKLIPDTDRLAEIAKDHEAAIVGGMFYSDPDDFCEILGRIQEHQDKINSAILDRWIDANVRWLYSGAWAQAFIVKGGKRIYSEFVLAGDIKRAVVSLKGRLLAR